MKIIYFLILANLSLAAYADNPNSVSTLQDQINSLQKAISQQQQSSAAAINDLQSQLNKLQSQITQYAAPDFQKFTWTASNGTTTPENAFVAVRNGNTPLYICQASYNNNANNYNGAVIDPGMLTEGGCVITYGGRAYLAPTYSVLVSTSPGAWVDGQQVQTSSNYPQPVMLAKANSEGIVMPAPAPTPNPNQPTPLLNQLALVGGQENGQNVYICRVKIGEQYFIGKAFNNTCYIAAGSKEASWPTYEVLLVRSPKQ